MTTTTTTTTTRPPDRPVVTRPRFAKGAAIVFAVLGTVIVGGYTAMAFTGYEVGAPAREEVPSSFRSSPGGYRTFHFWHSGYHGGK